MKRAAKWVIVMLAPFGAASAGAQEVRVHAKGGAAHAVTVPQANELGWGGGGALGAELTMGKYAGLQIQTGALGLSQGKPPSDPTLAQRSTGVMFGTSGGLRLNARGLWLDGGAGVAITGGEARPLLETSVGFDFRIGKRSPLLIGPYVGYEQILADPGALRPEDGRVLMFGLHAVLGSRPKIMAPPPVLEAKRPPKPKPPSDRDRDGLVDAEDACPDVFGVRTDDASTSGCPETPLRMVEDHLQLPDRIHFEFNSPKVQTRSLPLVRQIADYLQARGVVRVDIEGHADEIGSDDYNLTLSGERADEVKNLLVEYGVKAELVTHAYGESKPLAKGHSYVDRQQNRRVEFIVTLQRQVKEDAQAAQGDTHASN